MSETRRRFDLDFKEGAVRIVIETGKPIAEVARELGINPGTLANWVAMERHRRSQAGGVDRSSRRHRRPVSSWVRPRTPGAACHPHSAQAQSGPLGQRGAGPVSVARFIAAQRTQYRVPHAVACRALGVCQSWFYKWWRRDGLAPRAVRRVELDRVVAGVFWRRQGSYGSPRITAELREAGWRVGVNTVAASMARQQLVARSKRHRRGTTRAGRGRWRAEDLVRREFTATRVNQRWCGDGTEIPTGQGKLYLYAVLDLYSRRVPGFAMGAHHDQALATAALQTAVAVRGGEVAGVIFHSDQGSEYVGGQFRKACTRMNITQSMGRVGSALDNAAIESFNSTLEHELLSRVRFATRAEARHTVAAWIDDYNRHRRHSSVQMMSPVDFEQAQDRRKEAA